MTIAFTAGGPSDTLNKLRKSNWGDELNRMAAMASQESPSETKDAAELSVGEPYQVKYLALDDVADGKLVNAAHTTRWRHLLGSPSRPHAEVELDADLEPIALHEGPGKDGLGAALEAAKTLDGDFEACVLQSAPLKFSALLLQNDEQQFVIPYAPNHTDLPNYKVLSVDEALEVLQPLATGIMGAMEGDGELGG